MKNVGAREVLGIVLLATVVGGCAGAASTSLSPSASVTTAVQGWEHYFRLDWTEQAKPGGREIDGYLYNTYGSAAVNVRVLAQAIDGTGNVVGQKIEWVPGGVPPLSRGYFRVAGLPAANAYRVSVWTFDWLQSEQRDP